jgi:hypothetical protein
VALVVVYTTEIRAKKRKSKKNSQILAGMIATGNKNSVRIGATAQIPKGTRRPSPGAGRHWTL